MTKSRNKNLPKARWTAEMDTQLRSRYPHEKSEKIAHDLGLRVTQIFNRANTLGLKKTQEYLASPDACRLRRGGNVGAEFRFKPGQATWNKGMKGLNLGGVATQFKKGTRNGRALKIYQPIGAERISKDGYLERKVNDDMPFQKRWRAVHILVWEAANGPLPKGHAICFKDGNKANRDLANLELVSRADLMRRNTYHNYGPEIAQLIQLHAQITRQINKRERKAK